MKLRGLNHRDLLDIAWAVFLEPVAGDPKARAKVLEALRAPIYDGTVESKAKAKRAALATVGLTPATVKAMMEARRAAKPSA